MGKGGREGVREGGQSRYKDLSQTRICDHCGMMGGEGDMEQRPLLAKVFTSLDHVHGCSSHRIAALYLAVGV